MLPCRHLEIEQRSQWSVPCLVSSSPVSARGIRRETVHGTEREILVRWTSSTSSHVSCIENAALSTSASKSGALPEYSVANDDSGRVLREDSNSFVVVKIFFCVCRAHRVTEERGRDAVLPSIAEPCRSKGEGRKLQ